MLTLNLIHQCLNALPKLTIGIIGDLFLDQYLHLDPTLTEPSIETGLDAYQVTAIQNSPGAAGTVLNNLVALGVGNVRLLSVIGKDGRGFDLQQQLHARNISSQDLFESSAIFTPTYTKPMLADRELNRIDIKNRQPLPREAEAFLLHRLPTFFSEVDALLIVDQVTDRNTGVITDAVRESLCQLGQQSEHKLILADSRFRIHQFHNCATKPNEAELRRATSSSAPLPQLLETLEQQTQRPIFCTRGENGILLRTATQTTHIPAYPVQGPIDVVGAGDSTAAAIAAAYASGLTLEQAASFGNLVASITIQQLGTTGTASPEQVRKRFSPQCQG